MTSYADLVDATLARGVMPCVVPQLKSITLGGALAGVGIEATSFRQGLVHETVIAFDVLTGDGRIVHCTPDNEHRALFYGFPNSYGTLGYALPVTARTLPVRPFVALEHRRYANVPTSASPIVARLCDGRRHRLPRRRRVRARRSGRSRWGASSTRRPTPATTRSSASTTARCASAAADFLTTRDFLWRWDTDWFWCSKQLGAQHPLVRRLLGRKRLNSRDLPARDALEQPLGPDARLAAPARRCTPSR